MADLQTVRLKPNPSGKDRTRWGGASATQLGGEWADIENKGSHGYDLQGVGLYHVAYKSDGSSQWDLVMSFKGTLRPGQVMRIHAGAGPESVLLPEDKNGAEIHLFTGGNYVWNNDKADCAGLFKDSTKQIDKACYGANPPEGVILKRVVDSLIPSTTTAMAGSRRY